MANNSNDGSSDVGVSKCYVFKSRLQEYAQKANLPTPVYETIKEGPSHEPSFRSTVIVNDVRYNSLPGFFNRKAAEQSAAEVALLELSKTGEVSESISQPVHETGLCKNLLQEYAQKMNFAIPLYTCQKEELSGRRTLFTCSVEIGGIRYIGGSAKTKKEAEIKAARTALLAIQSSASESSHRLGGESQLTVVPSKKRGLEAGSTSASRDADDAPKPKKVRMKKKGSKRKHRVRNVVKSLAAIAGNTGCVIAEAEPSTFSTGWPNAAGKEVEVDGSSVPVVNQIIDPTRLGQPGASVITSGEMEKSAARVHHTSTVSVVVLVNQDTTAMPGMPSAGYEDVATFLTERNAEAWAGRVGSLSGNHTHAGNLETSSSIVLTGFDQSGERIQASAN